MKKFFGEIFIDKNLLEKEEIEYPIKIEYYKRINEKEIINKETKKYGIDVVKIEYLKDDIKIETKEIKYLSNEEEKVDEILTILKRNVVTPIGTEDVIKELKHILF